MIKVLVVDDSYFLRKTLTALIEQDGDIKVTQTARDGRDALRKIAEAPDDFDVVTMDVEMPNMNGLETLILGIRQPCKRAHQMSKNQHRFRMCHCFF